MNSHLFYPHDSCSHSDFLQDLQLDGRFSIGIGNSLWAHWTLRSPQWKWKIQRSPQSELKIHNLPLLESKIQLVATKAGNSQLTTTGTGNAAGQNWNRKFWVHHNEKWKTQLTQVEEQFYVGNSSWINVLYCSKLSILLWTIDNFVNLSLL
jgi:hypothetical protein